MSSILEVVGPKTGAAPITYRLSELGTVDLQTVFAHFDGSGAAGSFRPALTIRSQNGTILARVFPSETLAAGDTADVTFAPFLRGGAGAAPATGFTPLYEQVSAFTLEPTAPPGLAPLFVHSWFVWGDDSGFSDGVIAVDPGDPRVIAVPVPTGGELLKVVMSTDGLGTDPRTPPLTEPRYTTIKAFWRQGSPGAWVGAFPGNSVGTNTSHSLGTTSSNMVPDVPSDAEADLNDLMRWLVFDWSIGVGGEGPYVGLVFQVSQYCFGDPNNYIEYVNAYATFARIKTPSYD